MSARRNLSCCLKFQNFLVWLLVGSLMGQGFFSQPVGAAASEKIKPSDHMVFEGISYPEVSDVQMLRHDFTQALRERLSQETAVSSTRQTAKRWMHIQNEILAGESAPGDFRFDIIVAKWLVAKHSYFQFQFQECLIQLKDLAQIQKKMPADGYFYAPMPYKIPLLRGMCLLALHETKSAQLEFLEAIRLRPEVQLSLRDYSPEVIAQYENALKQFRQLQGQNESGSLSVNSDPPFMEVYWNGDYLGQTPLTLGQVSRGNHYIEIQGKSYASWRQRLTIQASQEERILAKMNPLYEGIQFAGNETSELARASSFRFAPRGSWGEPVWLDDLEFMARWFGVEKLTLVDMEPLGLDYRVSVTVFDATQKKIEKRVEKEFIHLADGAQVALGSVLKDLGVFEKSPEPLISQPSEAVLEEDLNPSKTVVTMGSWQDLSNEDFKRLQDESFPLVEEKDLRESFLEISEEFDPKNNILGGPLALDRAHKERESQSKVWYKKWWVWSLVGVVVAGAATGTALAVSGGGNGGYSPPALSGGPPAISKPSGVFVGSRK